MLDKIRRQNNLSRLINDTKYHNNQINCVIKRVYFTYRVNSQIICIERVSKRNWLHCKLLLIRLKKPLWLWWPSPECVWFTKVILHFRAVLLHRYIRIRWNQKEMTVIWLTNNMYAIVFLYIICILFFYHPIFTSKWSVSESVFSSVWILYDVLNQYCCLSAPSGRLTCLLCSCTHAVGRVTAWPLNSRLVRWGQTWISELNIDGGHWSMVLSVSEEGTVGFSHAAHKDLVHNLVCTALLQRKCFMNWCS